MRQYVLSALVVFAFLIYAWHQSAEGSSAISQVTQSPVPTQSPSPTVVPITGKYKDGTYTGDSVDAFYGNVQVKITISGGKLTDVVFLDYPKDRSTSRRISSMAMPILKKEAISAQNAQVDIVSGATQTTEGFQTSLASALTQAQ